jgi:hypothetical protein
VDGRSQEISRITIVHSLSEPRPVAHRQPLPPDTCARLTVEGPVAPVRYAVTTTDLDLGVLLGRYGRCDIAADGLPYPDSVSRVHALLLKEGDAVFVIDTASTNGTLVDGLRVPAAPLGVEAVIELGEKNRVLWRTTQTFLATT